MSWTYLWGHTLLLELADLLDKKLKKIYQTKQREERLILNITPWVSKPSK